MKHVCTVCDVSGVTESNYWMYFSHFTFALVGLYLFNYCVLLLMGT